MRLEYFDFATDIGRALYRWRVNELLGSGGSELRLAEDGEDIGRLVRVVDDARSDLVAEVQHSPDPMSGAGPDARSPSSVGRSWAGPKGARRPAAAR